MMYPVPSKLEYLNLSYNKLKILSPEAVKTLKNLRCLDLSGNILMVSNKKDILVLNLRFTPLTSSIQSYD